MQMKSILDDNYWLKWDEQNLLGGVVGSGIVVVRTGGTIRREDICHALCLYTVTVVK